MTTSYDKIGNGGNNGGLSAEQFSWFRAELAAHADEPTLVLGHHPLTVADTIVNTEPVVFDMNPQQAREIRELYAKTPGVFFHHAGHTHRNYRTSSLVAPNVTFQEVGATKEYRAASACCGVHEGGYALNFYKSRGELAGEWSERTRQEYFGLFPFYTAGTVGDRNYMVRRDMSGLRAA